MPISEYEKLVDDKNNVADKLIILKTRKMISLILRR